MVCEVLFTSSKVSKTEQATTTRHFVDWWPEGFLYNLMQADYDASWIRLRKRPGIGDGSFLPEAKADVHAHTGANTQAPCSTIIDFFL